MSHETAAPERKHLRTLERRIAHLEGKLEERKAVDGVLQGGATFEAAELAALRVAHETMRLYRDTAAENEYLTWQLLDEAAKRFEGIGGLKLTREELVEELQTRARLLEQLEQ
jgi:hypothetical protein